MAVTVEDVATIEAALERGGAPDTTKIWAMLETPAAMVNAVDIAEIAINGAMRG